MKIRKYILIICSGLTLGLAIDFFINGPFAFAGQYIQPNWSSGLVGYWSFDGKYTTAATTTDQSGNNNTGILTNTTNIAGISGQAFNFNGTTSYVDCGTSTSLDLTGALTVEAWVKSTKNNAALFQGIIAKANYSGDELGYFLSKRTDNKFYFQVSLGAYTRNEQSTYSDIAYTDNAWHHLTGVLLADGTHYLYVDGVQQTAHSGTGTFRPAASSQRLIIGTAYSDLYAIANERFGGNIDDVRVYNRALSADEIKSHYALTARKFRMASNDSVRWTNGLVGYWSFDGKYTNTSTTTDQSGTGNTGTLGGGTDAYKPIPNAGISGQGLKFDGVDDYVDIGNNSSLKNMGSAVTVEAWAKYYAYGGGTGQSYSVIAMKPPWTFLMENPSQKIRFRVTAGGVDTYAADSATHELNRWYHFVGTYDGANIKMYKDGVQVGTTSITGALGVSDTTAKIGTYTGTTYNFNGVMDEVRIYNRALTADEIKEHYNLTRRKFVADTPNVNNWNSGLVGYWSFNGKSTILNSTTSDSSGNGNDCTLGSGTGADSGDPLPVPGISGQALSFKGDYNNWVDCGNKAVFNFGSSTDFSIDLWIKPAPHDNIGNREFFSKGYQSNSGQYNGYIDYQTGQVHIGVKDVSGNSLSAVSAISVDDNNWHHLAVVFKRSDRIFIYIDGSLSSTSASMASIGSLDNSYSFTIGEGSWRQSLKNGSIDEFRIYNRALTPEEILQHYQMTKRSLKM